jgi:purine-nucleoside phosphorylase
LGGRATRDAAHPNRLVVCDWDPGDGRRRRTLLAWGRPHLYEGWERAQVGRPVSEIAAAGVAHVVLTNASGGLGAAVEPGMVIVARRVVDLQQAVPAAGEPPVLEVCAGDRAGAVAGALAPALHARPGTYVAVPGPQYETPAEAAWLATLGDAVGMSTAPEVEAALTAGAGVTVLSLVVNRSGDAAAHADVLAASATLAEGLRARLGAALMAATR